MNETYPNDADGDALRRITADGSDMTKPMVIDFHVAAPDQAAAEAIAEAAGQRGYQTKVYRHDDGAWTCECSKEMIATHEGVVSAQGELDVLSQPHGGDSDGWGTFGNADQDWKTDP
jgi:regulator of RNase E activity RraB